MLMFENEEVPFGYHKAHRLMTIASDPRLKSEKIFSLLPPSWDSIYKLTRLDDDAFAHLVGDGTVRTLPAPFRNASYANALASRARRSTTSPRCQSPP
jgi:hypothetical protein